MFTFEHGKHDEAEFNALKNAQKFATKESVQELPRTGLAYNNFFLSVHRRNRTISFYRWNLEMLGI